MLKVMTHVMKKKLRDVINAMQLFWIKESKFLMLNAMRRSGRTIAPMKTIWFHAHRDEHTSKLCETLDTASSIVTQLLYIKNFAIVFRKSHQ